MMLFGETVQSILPQDIPWWSPDYAIFVGLFYLVLFAIAFGLGWVLCRTYRDLSKSEMTCAITGPKT